MAWKKLNSAVSYWDKPVFKTKEYLNTMALSINKSTKNPIEGVLRVIVKREGDPNKPGFLDRSKLITVEGKNYLEFEEKGDLKIGEINNVINKLSSKDKFFIGLEDPDIFIENKIIHLYFTIAFKFKEKKGYEVYLGHAEGKDLENLKATRPVLSPIGKILGFKEVCISPKVIDGKRINLTESFTRKKEEGKWLITASEAKNMSKKWKYKRIVLGNSNLKYEWCSEDISPCTILPKNLVSYKNLFVGILNGRTKKRIINGEVLQGKFRPGLFLFNPKTGEIPWVSPEPLLEDPESKGITFASDFVSLNNHEGILYCHVNDSFVRAYKINFKELKKLLP